MRPVIDVDEALALIDAHCGAPEDFRLPVSESLLDPIGVSMALVTDRILSLGWEPDGYEQQDGYRIYRYKRME
jgi:hypothetical protein